MHRAWVLKKKAQAKVSVRNKALSLYSTKYDSPNVRANEVIEALKTKNDKRFHHLLSRVLIEKSKAISFLEDHDKHYEEN